MVRQEIVIYGISLKPPEANAIHLYNTIDEVEAGNIALLEDKLYSQYFIFGKVIAVGEEEGLPLIAINAQELGQYAVEVAKALDDTDLFAIPSSYLPLKLYILTHYSYEHN